MAPPFADPPPFDNSGHGPLVVPGFGTLPVEIELQPQDRFTHGNREWVQEQNLTARELAMLTLMDEITDKATWAKDVFDDNEVAKLREQALEKTMISEKTWVWCLAELRDKAIVYEETGRILVYNTGAGICKCDINIKDDLTTTMKDNVASLMDSISGTKGSQRGPDGLLRDLVDPRLYPLVYGRSTVLLGPEAVELDNMFKHNSTGTIAPEPLKQGPFFRYAMSGDYAPNTWHSVSSRSHEWSTRFQALPCEIQFSGHIGTDVRITSYINNLHPGFKNLYNSIEKLVALSIRPWDEVLIKENRGRTPLRIKTYGISYGPPAPNFERYREASKHTGTKMYLSATEEVKTYCALPEPPSEGETLGGVYPFYFNLPDDLDEWCREGNDLERLMWQKWNRICRFEHPEPGVSFTYEQWKAGHTGEAIVHKPNKSRNDPSTMSKETEDPDHEFYKVTLEESFRQKGLQIIVRISTVELSPDTPRFPGTDWLVEGLQNEHIVANTIFVFDESNVSESRMGFRQATKMEEDDYIHYGGDEEFLDTFAVPYKEHILQACPTGPPSIQQMGSVKASLGRLIAWPNALHHRLKPFELLDKTQPGYRRFVVLSLVDPNHRVCSTRNVSPQQHDWWANEALFAAAPRSIAVPTEIFDLIDGFTQQWPMGIAEAEEIRMEMAKEQKEHEYYVMNVPGFAYDFNVDDLNYDFPANPDATIGEDD